MGYIKFLYYLIIHTATKLKLFEIVTGYESNFNTDLKKQIMNNYLENHREKMLLYSLINKINEIAKRK